MLRWNISDRTQVTFELEYKNSRDPIDIGVPALGNRPAPVPGESYLGERGDRTDSDYLLGGFNWSHAFNDSWTLRHAFYANTSDALASATLGIGLDPNDPTNRTLARGYLAAEAQAESHYTTLDLTGKFNTWGMEHTLLLGGDYSFNETTQTGGFISFPSIDLFQPIHVGPPSRDVISQLAKNPTLFSVFGGDFYGLYLQDQVRLPYDVHLLAGFRYDNATARNGTFGDPTGPISELTDDAVTPRFGLLWRAVPQLTLYGNYVENFGRSNLGSLDRNSQALLPESAQQWEVGAKTESLDGRFTGTLAYYDLTKQNIRAPDPDPLLAAQGFSVAIGEVQNRGVEFDLSGEVLPGWRWIGSYSYIDSEITKDDTGLQGNRLSNVPRHGGSLWTTYEVQQGYWRGITLGGGVVARSQVQGDTDNSFQIPGYAAVNLLAGYSWKAGPSKISLQLNVDNLLDKDYFSGSDGSPSVVLYGTPRTFLGSVRVEF